MSTTIGGVTLTEDMVWTDQYKYNQLNTSVTPTIGGGIVVQEYSKSEAGTPITLESTDGFGYQKKSVIDSLIALASTPNMTYSILISYEGLTLSKTIRFRNEEAGGAIQFEQALMNEGLQDSDTYYQGKIMMMIV